MNNCFNEFKSPNNALQPTRLRVTACAPTTSRRLTTDPLTTPTALRPTLNRLRPHRPRRSSVCPALAGLGALGVMRASSLIVAVLALLFTGVAYCPAAKDKPLDEEFLRGFIAGEYDLIGRKPDSTTAYTGRVTLRDDAGILHVTRTINGKTDKTTMRFTIIGGADRIPVARARFVLDGVEYEATYMWSSDADNYPRITGYTYRPDNQTKSPGLEALFPVHQ